jgi:RCC1 and BTB domain-containing protein
MSTLLCLSVSERQEEIFGVSEEWGIISFVFCSGREAEATARSTDAGAGGVTSASSAARSSLSTDFATLLDAPEFADVRFTVDGRVIHAHRAILAYRSAHFRTMFASGMREARSSEVAISSVRYEVIRAVLQFICTDTVDLTPELAIEVFNAADMFAIDRLRAASEAVVLVALSVDSASAVLAAADSMNALALRESVLQFVVRDFDRVSKTEAFDLLSRDLILEVIKRR